MMENGSFSDEKKDEYFMNFDSYIESDNDHVDNCDEMVDDEQVHRF